MKTFRQYFVEQQASKKTVVFAYGRFNPPTVAHNMLIDKVIETATQQQGDYFIIPSHSVKPPDKNPLTAEQKIKILQYMVTDSSKIGTFGQTYIAALQKLQELGYNNVIQIAGSDRIPEFSSLVNKYNGKQNKAGEVVFDFNQFEFVSAGNRDTDASKLRKLALDGNVEEFKLGMTKTVPNDVKMETYKQIRKVLKNE